MQPALVLAIWRDSALDGFEIGEKVSMSQHNAARFGGGAGGEEDLRDGISSNGLVGEGRRVATRVDSRSGARLVEGVGQILHIQGSDADFEIWFAGGGKHQLGGCFTCNTSGK